MHSDNISLQNDTDIIIKSADKGSGVVVWDKEDYLKEAASQLSDDNVYEKIDFDPSSALRQEIRLFWTFAKHSRRQYCLWWHTFELSCIVCYVS